MNTDNTEEPQLRLLGDHRLISFRKPERFREAQLGYLDIKADTCTLVCFWGESELRRQGQKGNTRKNTRPTTISSE